MAEDKVAVGKQVAVLYYIGVIGNAELDEDVPCSAEAVAAKGATE